EIPVHMDMHGRSHDLDPGVLRAFRAVIRDDNRCVRNIAARVLGNHGGSATYELFLGLLRDSRPDLRETGALGLGELADSRAIGEIQSGQGIAVLEALLRDQTADVRKTALWALGEIQDGSGVEPAAAALKEADPEVRTVAAWALGEIQDERAVTPLVAALKDS